MTEVALAPELEISVPAAAPIESFGSDPSAAALADCSPEQQVELRYLAALKVLVDDALEHRHVESLVEALTWNLARIGFGFGMPAIGDILRRLGAHVGEFAQSEAAQREAAEAKKAGRMMQ